VDASAQLTHLDSETELFTDTDKVFSSFCKSCVANPTNCSLAADKITASELEASIYAFLDDLKFNPIDLPLPTPFHGTKDYYTTLKAITSLFLYSPRHGLSSPPCSRPS
jgi:hypothetical protein